MIWILLPAYNEAESLPRLVPRIAATLAGTPEWRIVVVDDGSTDATPAVLQRLCDEFPVEVVTHPLNRGLGETERDGFEYIARRAAPDDVIIRMDCDDTHEPEFVHALLRTLRDGCDVVNTSRFRPGGGQSGVSPYRALVSRFANWFMLLVFRIPGLRDYSCGYRAYRAHVIQDAVRVYGNNFIQLRGLGFTSTLEMVVKLHLLGCRFAEVPFHLRYDQKASPSKMVTSITTLGYLAMALLYHWPFGGWAWQYRGLRRMYRDNPTAAVASYAFGTQPIRLPGRVGL